MTSKTSPPLQKTVLRESARLVGCLLFGVLVLPIAIFWVGQAIFGDFGGGQLGDFYASLMAQLRTGNSIVWFLVLAPYLIWQCLRATVKLFRIAGARQA